MFSKFSNSGIQTRKSLIMSNFLKEFKENIYFDNIIFDNKADQRNFNHKIRNSNNFSKINNLNNKRLPLRSINNNFSYNINIKSNFNNNLKYNNNSFLKKDFKLLENKIYTKEKIEFFDEITFKKIKIKKFKEDDVPFTKSKILPEIEWQKIDNDILTDDDQIENGYKKEMNWLGDTIKKIEKNHNYLKENIDKDKKFKIKKW
jgi:hypothetical protein